LKCTKKFEIRFSWKKDLFGQKLICTRGKPSIRRTIIRKTRNCLFVLFVCLSSVFICPLCPFVSLSVCPFLSIKT
jgi:hypothetical protein